MRLDACPALIEQGNSQGTLARAARTNRVEQGEQFVQGRVAPGSLRGGWIQGVKRLAANRTVLVGPHRRRLACGCTDELAQGHRRIARRYTTGLRASGCREAVAGAVLHEQAQRLQAHPRSARFVLERQLGGNGTADSPMQTRRTELIVLMVPRVIRNTEEAQSTLDDLMGGFKAANELMRDGIRVPLQLAD